MRRIWNDLGSVFAFFILLIRILKSVSWNISTEFKTDERKINCYANNINVYISYKHLYCLCKFGYLKNIQFTYMSTSKEACSIVHFSRKIGVIQWNLWFFIFLNGTNLDTHLKWLFKSGCWKYKDTFFFSIILELKYFRIRIKEF